MSVSRSRNWTPRPIPAKEVQAGSAVTANTVRHLGAATEALSHVGVGMRHNYVALDPDNAPRVVNASVDGTAKIFKIDITNDADFALPVVRTPGFTELRALVVFALSGRAARTAVRMRYVHPIVAASTTITGNWVDLSNASYVTPNMETWNTLLYNWKVVMAQLRVGPTASTDDTAYVEFDASFTLPYDVYGFGANHVNDVRIMSVRLEESADGVANRGGV